MVAAVKETVPFTGKFVVADEVEGRTQTVLIKCTPLLKEIGKVKACGP